MTLSWEVHGKHGQNAREPRADWSVLVTAALNVVTSSCLLLFRSLSMSSFMLLGRIYDGGLLISGPCG